MRKPAPTSSSFHVVKQRVDHRSRNQRQQQRERLSANHHDRDRTPLFSTRTRAQRQRRHTCHQRECCHQNRAQTIAVTLHDRFTTFHSLRAQVVHVIDL